MKDRPLPSTDLGVIMIRSLGLALAFLILAPSSDGQDRKKRPYRLPSTDLKKRIIWGSEFVVSDDLGLAFGGQDQEAEDGRPHTRVHEGGKWRSIHGKLHAGNPLKDPKRRCLELSKKVASHASSSRSMYLSDVLNHRSALSALSSTRQVLRELWTKELHKLESDLASLQAEVTASAARLEIYEARQAKVAAERIRAATEAVKAFAARPEDRVHPSGARRMTAAGIELEKAAEALGAEPPARALSQVIYEPRTRLFLVFGGDHLDYLTNDTWLFNPARKKWMQAHPQGAPPPRANHTLIAPGDGTIVLKGGYTYASNTDYVGGQYLDHDDGEWAYDVRTNTWAGKGNLAPADSRTYRTGPFHPDFYLGAPAPDWEEVADKLASLPANTWVPMNPPRLPRLNRDWGTAVLDGNSRLILRWSGGHSAHGGTDVLHYHLYTNRWELRYPVEFPLGQLYSNTSYPAGYNFNLRPWVTGHTYQSYGVDPKSQKLVFTGQRRYSYLYDPLVGNWVSRAPKPAGMDYGSCFYTLTLTSTRRGLMCWTKNGKVYRYVPETSVWSPLELRGDKLPGAVVDNSTAVYDSKRDRLVFARKLYGRKHVYDGELYALDFETKTVSKLSPDGRKGAAAIPYLCQIRYDEKHDLMLVGGLLPPGDDGFRRTPAYDGEKNRWVSLKITGDDPNGKKGRNVSLGLMYDVVRKLFWAVDTQSRVYVLRLDPASADVRPLQ